MKNVLIASSLLVFAISVQAQELPLGMLAVKIPEAAIAAVKFRDEGKPKEFLTNALPPKGSAMTRVGKEMHQIADDIYEYYAVKNIAYYAYTHSRFMQELNGKTAPTQFKEVANGVLACQEKFPESDQQKLIQCVVEVVQKYEPRPL